MLSRHRVLDLTAERGAFCSYLLAHLGADVVVVEPPGGSSLRRLAPFERDGAAADGLWWQAYARGKRNRVLDLETDAGRAAIRELVADADIVIESFANSDVMRLGFDYASLAAINPGVVVVSITPFGRDGPKTDWPATDLTIWASSGAHVLAGDNDRAPVRTSVPQAFLHAGADAAGAALIALHERQASGRGQHIDVSAQQSSAQAALSANLAAPNAAGLTIRRAAGGLSGAFPIRLTWPCRDGYVAIAFLFGAAFTEPNRRLLRWIGKHGFCSTDDIDTDWGLEVAAMVRGERPPEAYFALCGRIENFTRARSQHELFEEGLANGCYIAPTLDIDGLLAEHHFHARGFWHEIETRGASRSRVRVPGAFARFSAHPFVPPGPAPRLADASATTVFRARMPEAAASSHAEAGRLPLAGLKVLDFMWVIAGPTFTRMLADYGATVIKVESGKRIEPARGQPPFRNGAVGVENGMPFANFNAGKMSITVDPSNPAGRQVILDLVAWADVVTESFSPKAMKAWRLDYASLREVNPRVVMLSSCLMGQTGPRAYVPGYGNMAAAITGFYDLTGWADRSPAGPYLAYTDGLAPRFMLISLLAALELRRRTGEGQHIDISQAEAAIHLLAPAILDHELNGHTWHRDGNRDLEFCPHGVYPARGEDRWMAIACQSDQVWPALCRVMGFDALLADPALATAVGRRRREGEIEAQIADWTRARDEGDIERALIDAGVAAHVVQNSAECFADPQLRHRRHFIEVGHSTLGPVVVEGSRFRLSRTPARIERAGPLLGEHNGDVLTDILRYDADRIADVFASMAME